MRNLRAVMAMALVALVTTSASAATVTYYTDGVFGSNNLNSVTVGGITITFTGQSSTTLTPVPPTAAADLGDFLTSGSGSGNFSDTFTLKIYQSSPSNTSGQYVGSVSGTLYTSSGLVQINFNPQTLWLGNVSYTLANNPMYLNVPSQNTPSDVRALVNVVPLPSTAWAGLSLMGLLGVARIRKAMK